MSEIIISDNYTKAHSLDIKIKANAQIVQQSLYEMCKDLKEMRDGKLYKELGYSEFNDYCKTELGISDRNAYRYISISENLPADLVTSMSLIGMTKLTMLAKLDGIVRTEVLETTDISKISVKELQKQLKELQEKNTALEMETSKYICENSKYKSDVEKLEHQVQELESRPVEVAVKDNDEELDKLREQMADLDDSWSEKYEKLQDDTARSLIQSKQKHATELNELKSNYANAIAEYEIKLKETENSVKTVTVTDTKELFEARLEVAIDSGKRLIDFISKHDDEFYKSKAIEFFESMIKEIGGIK